MVDGERQTLEGLTILITGAANGVGREAALGAARRGATTVLLDRDASAVAETAASIEAEGFEARALTVDIVLEEQVAEAFETAAKITSGIDVVMNIAGIMRGQRLDIREVSEDLWDHVVDVNLKGSFLVAKHSAIHMIPRKRGTIILVASRSGITVPSGSMAYGASKGGINGFSMSLARQLSPAGLRVNTLCSGDVDTPLMRASLDEALLNGADPQEVQRLRESLGTAAEVAEVLLHLADPHAGNISGTIFSK